MRPIDKSERGSHEVLGLWPGRIAAIGSRLKAALCRAHINVADFDVTGFFGCQATEPSIAFGDDAIFSLRFRIAARMDRASPACREIKIASAVSLA